MKSHPLFKETFDVFTDGGNIWQITREHIGRIIAGMPTELPEEIEQRIHQKYDPAILGPTITRGGSK